MKLTLLCLFALTGAALAVPVKTLGAFELSDQHEKPRVYRFPKSRVSVITVADHKGSDQLAPWIERLYARYEKRIDIDGIADVSMIPRAFHGVFRRAFKKQLTYTVMLDWGGRVVKQFGHTKGVANLYVVDRDGDVVKHLHGPVTDEAMRTLARVIDETLLTTTRPRREDIRWISTSTTPR